MKLHLDSPGAPPISMMKAWGILGCAMLVVEAAQADSTVYQCHFDTRSVFRSARIVHDHDSQQFTVSGHHLDAGHRLREKSYQLAPSHAPHLVVISYEVFSRGRLIRQDMFEIDRRTGKARAYAELFNERGDYIRGGPGGVNGQCRIKREPAPRHPSAGAPARSSARSPVICHREYGPTQFYDSVQYCVSSVLAPQAGATYGPRHLFRGDTQQAWCASHGAGEVIRMHFEPRIRFRTLVIRNGYQKSHQTFLNNSRPANIEVRVGHRPPQSFRLADRRGEQRIKLAQTLTDSLIDVRILSVYPGQRFTDTCLASIHPDLEEADAALGKATTVPPP